MKYLTTVFSAIKNKSPFLYYTVLIHLACIVPCVMGVLIDERTLMGVNVWIKPLKFAISGAIYIASVGFLITFYPFSQKKKSIINNTVAITLLVEYFIILYQGFRGVKSHYNMDNPFDGLLFGMMGILVGVNVIIMILFIIETAWRKLETSKVIQWSIFIGWLIVFFGSWIGGQMISQMSHNVGIADGGDGLPLLNWSTVAGDLRVAHFFGLHGLQVIPLFAFIVSGKWKASEVKTIFMVSIFALIYVSWIGYTFYQAKQGIPFLKM